MSWISVVKLDVNTGEAKPYWISNAREAFINSLDSQTRINEKDIDMSEFKVGKKNYAFLYNKKDQKNKKKGAAAISRNGKVEIRGNVIIAKVDPKTGRALSLNSSDIDNILNHKVRFISEKSLTCFDSIQLDHVDTKLNSLYRKYVGR